MSILLRKWRPLLLVALLLLPDAFALAQQDRADPWKPLNERIFAFNEFMDERFVRPVAVTYSRYVPNPLQIGVHNFLNNLYEVNVLFNDLMQLKFREAATDSGRLLINSTIGVAGVIDIADRAGLERNNEDFGQTLGYWGVGPGPYLVLPGLGPSTVRDAVGLTFDTLTGPMQMPDEAHERNLLHVLDLLDQRVQALQFEGMVTGDEYLFMREAYLQQRRYEVRDGENMPEDDWQWD